MRLIDADALKEKIEQSNGEGTIARYCKRVLAECLDNDAPTIDAITVAKYKAEIETLRSRCYPGAEDAFGRKAYGCLKIVPVSYGTKSVDAIPVEWLDDKFMDIHNKDKALSRAAWLVLHAWRQEQEAR